MSRSSKAPAFDNRRDRLKAPTKIDKRRERIRLLLIPGVIGILLLLDVLTSLLAESFWFQQNGYGQMFRTRVLTQGGVGFLVFGVSLAVLWGNLAIAHRRRQDVAERSPERGLRLRGLLPLTFGFSLIVSLSLFYYGQIAASHWHPRLELSSMVPQLPVRVQPTIFLELVQSVVQQPWQLATVLGLAVALLLYPSIFLWVSSLLTSLGFALVLSENWLRILPALSPVPFRETDPVLNANFSFYIFRLPFLELLIFWVLGLLFLTTLAVAMVYMLGNNSLSDGRFLGFGKTQLHQLYTLSALTLLAIALSTWTDRYELLFSPSGVNYGASFTDVKVRLPAATFLAIATALLSLLLLFHAQRIQLTRIEPFTEQRFRTGVVAKSPFWQGMRTLVALWLGYVGLMVIANYLLPVAIQRIVVQPNELTLELPFLERTIALTRQAFGLDQIESAVFDPQTNLTQADLQNNLLTTENIRLWDTRPLLETNRQLQRIRPYYEFPSADIDRYVLPSEQDGELRSRQVLIASRELDYNSVPADAQTWVNEHLIFTHGYGFTLSPVNTAAEGGLPAYFVEGVEQNVSDSRIRDVIPTDNPRIYFGELTNTYVMAPTRVPELDYPSGSENIYNAYDGRAGIPIGSYWRRVLYAKHMRDWRMLFSADITPQTRILFRRNIAERVRAIAPFLRYDNDPYPVVVNLGDWPAQNSPQPLRDGLDTSPSYLYWVMDAYTTSDRFPYSDPLGNDFNYIRNSVKVVMDAYNGAVWFFIADPNDPIIQTWNRLLPGMFKPLDEMPAPLLQHIRYPQDYYNAQANQLMVYHMTDPQVFYNREDQWRSPNEIYGAEEQPVKPYYLIMKLPIGSDEEFLLFNPFAPAQRTNLIAWMAARSDNQNYGKILLYRFPKQKLIFGTEQIEARINQDPVISQQISLWNRRGSQAIQGNLLIIPIEESLLYVEPLYLQAEQNQIPTLVRVIVAYGNQIVMAETLQQALDAIFTRPSDSETPAIVRPLENTLGENDTSDIGDPAETIPGPATP
ncbi:MULTISPECIES: UPF0182 family protein [unclassified Leptolyngbya]|uniref:UPF0182 family protein n=1 Tax=unclassified Leptolyngbya TaxID=2650499 RepID=UPI00168339FD|nr:MULTISPECIES: UPF0182 family protein [unclassified Leptolyngbya]MBD1913480.1 UPF0182 family protein [Leptolyngbya sp. FACHB-8]MBD2154894.1 UPF0182 family protein [Leptolyngbya sp. FACHB-16]